MKTFTKQHQGILLKSIRHALKGIIPLAGLLSVSGFVQADCIDSTKIINIPACEKIYDPVCGCNDVTYDNVCFAEASGVTSYTKGKCPNEILQSMFLMPTELIIGDTAWVYSEQAGDNIDWDTYKITCGDSSIVTNKNLYEEGQILCVGEGSTSIVITSTVTGDSIHLPVTVKSAEYITINRFFIGTTSLWVGEQTEIYWDAKCKCMIDWGRYSVTSSDSSIAMAIGDGKIMGVSSGEVLIMLYDNTSGEHQDFKVNVSEHTIWTTLYLTKNPLIVGDTASIVSSTVGMDINWSAYTITYSDESIVTNNSPELDTATYGRFVCIGEGETTIVIESIESGVKRIIPVYVFGPDSTTLDRFFITNQSIAVGDQTEITWDLRCRCEINWSRYSITSSDSSIATIIGDGKIMGVSRGEASIRLHDSLTGEFVDFKVNVTGVDPNDPWFANIYLDTDAIALGDTTQIQIKNPDGFLWSDFSFSAFDQISVSPTGVIVGWKVGTGLIQITHVPTQTKTFFTINVNYELFTESEVYLEVGETAQLKVNPTYSDFFYVKTDDSDNIIFDETNMSVTATKLGSGYAGILFYYLSDSSFAEGLKIHINDSSSTQELPIIQAVKLLNNGYTLEIKFEKPVEIYDGIENDINVFLNSTLKAGETYRVKKVMAKVDDPYTLVLIMEDQVPTAGFSVQYKTASLTAVATSVKPKDDEIAVSLFPNPAHNSITLSAPGLMSVELVSMAGEKIVTVQAIENVANIDLDENVPAGQYLARFITQTNVINRTVILK